MSSAALEVQPVADQQRPELAEILRAQWGSTQIVSRGRSYDASRLPALVCLDGDRIVGMATFEFSSGDCQVLTLNALEQQRGIGSLLLESVIQEARGSRCRRLWLLTSNDNLDAMRFYQRRGLHLVAVYPGAIDEERRRFKPEIPLIGNYEIPIRDELEFELVLEA